MSLPCSRKHPLTCAYFLNKFVTCGFACGALRDGQELFLASQEKPTVLCHRAAVAGQVTTCSRAGMGDASAHTVHRASGIGHRAEGTPGALLVTAYVPGSGKARLSAPVSAETVVSGQSGLTGRESAAQRRVEARTGDLGNARRRAQGTGVLRFSAA